MERWKQLGAFIGKHMAYFVPLCVATGVLLPGVFGPLKAIVPFIFAIMTFQGSLSNTFRQLVEVFRHPLKLLAILLIAEVFMPVLAYLLGTVFFGSNPNLVAGIVLEYSVPIAVISFMWVGIYEGDGPLCLASILVSTVISPVTIPLTLSVLLGASIHIDAMGMMTDMLFMIALPALAGIVVDELNARMGTRNPLPRPFTGEPFHHHHPHYGELNLDERVRVAHEPAAPRGSRCLSWCSRPRAFSGDCLPDASCTARNPCSQPRAFAAACATYRRARLLQRSISPARPYSPVMCGTLFQQILAATFGHVIEHLCAEDTEERERKVSVAKRLLRTKDQRQNG